MSEHLWWMLYLRGTGMPTLLLKACAAEERVRWCNADVTRCELLGATLLIITSPRRPATPIVPGHAGFSICDKYIVSPDS